MLIYNIIIKKLAVDLKKLLHTGYSKTRDQTENTYKGRERINSRTKSVQGKVYCPVSLEKKMDAIVVDYEVDEELKKYIAHMEEYIRVIGAKLQKAGQPRNFETLLDIISKKISIDFPYSKRMIDDKYIDRKYTPGTKVRLGVFMQNQDMICRHMGLLAAAILEHFKDNFRKKKKGVVTLNPDDYQIRFMADYQTDEVQGRNSGHAYVVIRRWIQEEKKWAYYVVDPTGGVAVDIESGLNNKRELSPGACRYIFSLLRYLLQEGDILNHQFIYKLINRAKWDINLRQTLNAVHKALDMDGKRYLEKLKVNAVMQGK